MNIHYRVISYNDDEHSFVVRYWTDILSEISLANFLDNDNNPVLDVNGYPVRCRTDINISINDPNPSTEGVIYLIKKSAPTLWFYTLEQKTLSNTSYSLSNVSSMLNQSEVFTFDTSTLRINTLNTIPISELYKII